MPDPRPVAFIIGLIGAVMGVLMLLPALTDWLAGDDNWRAFLGAAMLSITIGGLSALATANSVSAGLTLRQSFLLTTFLWVLLPILGALPFMLGAPGAGLLDAYFEAVSGMTTTGTTVFTGLDDMPPGVLLWRSLLQWMGGLGIVVVALVFLPVMKVGGMQYFRAEAFDTLGKVLPRTVDIARALLEVYLVLTGLCALAYLAAGLPAFDALNHALTTVATGGFSTRDESFVAFVGPAEYVAVLFMILAGLPFIRFVQLVSGTARPLLEDVQVRAYLRWTFYAVALVVLYRAVTEATLTEATLRESAFNVVSLFSGTGYGSADIETWGGFPLVVVMIAGMVGACTASTGCSIKVFRYLVLIEAVRGQLRRIHSPSRVVPLRLQGRPLEEDVINSVIALFTLFLVGFGVIAVLLTMTGLETRTAVTAAWTAIGNIGPAFGPEVGPTGAVDGFPAASKAVMIVAMLLGRLEILSVLVLLLPRFWRG